MTDGQIALIALGIATAATFTALLAVVWLIRRAWRVRKLNRSLNRREMPDA